MASIISYQEVQNNDHLIVMGAGPSINQNINRIKDWQQEKKAIVIGTNYKYKIFTDYVVFIDNKIYQVRKKEVIGKLIVGQRVHWKSDKTLYDRILVIKHKKTPSYLYTKNIKISSTGFINHETGSAGFAALLISGFFNPKEILVAGLDGPSKKTMKHFASPTKTLKNKNKKWFRNNIYYFLKVITFLKKKKINILSFKNDNFWGIDRNKAGVTFL
jgi:hypothetical protein